MQVAFKEWAVVVDALGRGEQIVILRKGGIHEGRGGFQVEHPEFFLFPTLFHQQREAVLPHAQARFDQLLPLLSAPDRVRIEYLARVVTAERLDSLETVQRLQGQHIWRPEVIAERYDWGRSAGIFALAARVHRLPRPTEIPLLPEYGGCKSWIQLAPHLPTEPAEPVLNDADFKEKLAAFQQALRPTASEPIS